MSQDAKMIPDGSGTTMFNARIPDSWVPVIDAKAKQLEATTGARYSRTDVVRMALARFLDLIEKQAEDQPQPTT
jgi:hypothetical protein